jgi:cell cycle protein kinase DBF2
MAKYAEVREKQRNVDLLKEKDEPFARGVWVGFTFGKNGPGLKALNAMDDGGDDQGTLTTIF